MFVMTFVCSLATRRGRASSLRSNFTRRTSRRLQQLSSTPSVYRAIHRAIPITSNCTLGSADRDSTSATLHRLRSLIWCTVALFSCACPATSCSVKMSWSLAKRPCKLLGAARASDRGGRRGVPVAVVVGLEEGDEGAEKERRVLSNRMDERDCRREGVGEVGRGAWATSTTSGKVGRCRISSGRQNSSSARCEDVNSS